MKVNAPMRFAIQRVNWYPTLIIVMSNIVKLIQVPSNAGTLKTLLNNASMEMWQNVPTLFVKLTQLGPTAQLAGAPNLTTKASLDAQRKMMSAQKMPKNVHGETVRQRKGRRMFIATRNNVMPIQHHQDVGIQQLRHWHRVSMDQKPAVTLRSVTRIQLFHIAPKSSARKRRTKE
jgi:hypothetical protein